MAGAEGTLSLGFVMVEGFPMACLTSAIEPLRAANEIAGRRAFAWRLLSEDGGAVRSSAEVRFNADARLAAAEGLDQLYVLSPPGGRLSAPGAARLRWLARHGVTVGGFSGGVFPLGRAGLLDGHRASVHWCYEAAFKAEFPEVSAEETVILRDRGVVTAAGAGAVFDLMLRLIEERIGRETMTEVACWFQHPFVRDEAARQKVPVARAGGVADAMPAPVRAALRLFAAHLEDPIRIAEVAAQLGMSERHFERLFRRATGQSPLRHYRLMRLLKARQRVLHSAEPLGEIAAALGFSRSGQMARHYAKAFGVTPLDERRLVRGVRGLAPAAE
jgi:transcriptional regulator GlxA family with amidase domain